MSVRNGSPFSSEGIPNALELEVAKFQHSQFLPFICPPLSDREGVPILEQLISQSLVEVSHITYQDFLPFSAAGIFQSKLQSGNGIGRPMGTTESSSNQKRLEEALGMELLDLDNWYACAQRQSLETVSKELGFALGGSSVAFK
ncbi:uncharacterized protein ASPGLDRAFT_485361 [Aspergillus glaucus CBS 516.65]|uniref:2-oxoadipate dioxygenase/decarboxylase n=1 Tax=Aspergillus glaucus CBS 516.65 TaxID=1160497 RepID=A0A1L9VFQ7_ASPGL|nr:hypothetical protein ASPGLDRAFT_485361 [Aspergillus glaucus CBS 516.65]OJJ82662.1 hypothetical protein ASPGLDRAFT_485361 [Aspergillus glaucus CBS 516.65]